MPKWLLPNAIYKQSTARPPIFGPFRHVPYALQRHAIPYSYYLYYSIKDSSDLPTIATISRFGFNFHFLKKNHFFFTKKKENRTSNYSIENPSPILGRPKGKPESLPSTSNNTNKTSEKEQIDKKISWLNGRKKQNKKHLWVFFSLCITIFE